MVIRQGKQSWLNKCMHAALAFVTMCSVLVAAGCGHVDSLTGTASHEPPGPRALTGNHAMAPDKRHPVALHHRQAYFEPNQGQFSEAVKYAVHGQGTRAYLTDTGFVSPIVPLPDHAQSNHSQSNHSQSNHSQSNHSQSNHSQNNHSDQNNAPRRWLKLDFANAQATGGMRGERGLPGKSHYLRGKDSTRWLRNVPHYETVRNKRIYPGIDVLYYLRDGELEYDLILAPHADARALGFEIQGADKVSISAAGDLLIEAGATRLLQKAPRIYQYIGAERREIDGGYRLANSPPNTGQAPGSPFATRKVELWLADYDAAHELVVDPVLVYSSFYGGSGSENVLNYLDTTTINGIEVDGAGNAYISGNTNSTDLPLAGTPYAPALNGATDAFIAKYDVAGAMLYATYLGGATDNDNAYDLTLGADGSVYVVGETFSTDFPTVAGALRPNKAGGTDLDGFVARLNAAGDTLLSATYIGNDTTSEGVVAIDLNASGEILLAGYALFPAAPFTAPASFQPNPISGDEAFVMHLNAAASSTLYASYLGGSGDDYAYDIEVRGGLTYVVGSSFASTTPFPTTVGAVVTGGSNFDGFLSILDTSQTGAASLIYSARLGGLGVDKVQGVAVDGTGDVYLTGQTASNDFPVSPVRYDGNCGGLAPFDCQSSGLPDGFVMKLRPGVAAASAVLYSTFVGGDGFDQFIDIVVDASGNAYVGGTSLSSNFPSVGQIPLFTTPGGMMGVLVKVIPDGGSLAFASLYGGSGDDAIGGLDIDAANNIYFTGATSSTDIPIVNAAQATAGANGDAFVARLAFANVVNVTSDLPDVQPGNGVCETVVPGECSLRAAIQESNVIPGPDLILFDIPLTQPGCVSGVCTIQPLSALPTVLDAITIDGYTQPGASPNSNPAGTVFNTVLTIELSGALAGVGASGLELQAADSLVQGLVINRFAGNGLTIGPGKPVGNVFVRGNFIGTDSSGTFALGNGQHGIGANDMSVYIGGPNIGDGNLISGNALNGIGLIAVTANNVIQGNFIGTDITGGVAIGNGQHGVSLENILPGVTIGGGGLSDGNLISGNGLSGVQLLSNNGTLVRGNYIGTDLLGSGPLPNGEGVSIGLNTQNNEIGGPTLSDGNLIAFNAGNGISLAATALTGNLISLNSIYSNGGLGIDLNDDGVTANDPLDADLGPNGLTNFPLLVTATDLGGSLEVLGDYQGAPASGFTLEFFENSSCDATGNGEGERYLGSVSQTTDGLGDAVINTILPVLVTPGNFISATARVPGAGSDTSEFSNCVIIDVPASIDLAMLKTGPASVATNGIFNYSLRVSNAGPSTATSVSVIDTLPPSLSYVSASGPLGACSFNPPTVSCPMGSIPAASLAIATLTVRAPGAPTTVSNSASVSALEPDINTLNNVSTAITNVVQTDADLMITKTASSAVVNLGGSFTYTLNVRNNGPIAATGVNVSDAIPAALSVAAFNASQGSCNLSGNTLGCALGGLAAGASASVSIDVNADVPGTIINTAIVSASQSDPNPGNNSASASVVVNAPQADLELSVALPPNVSADSFFDVFFSGGNLGPQAATGVSFDWTPPTGFGIVSVMPSVGSCLPSTSLVHCDIGALAAGGTFALTVNLRAPESGIYSSVATIAGNEADPHLANNSVTFNLDIARRVADLSISKTVTPDPARIGEELLYQLTIANAGPEGARGIVVVDSLPTEVAFVSVQADHAACTHDAGLLRCTLAELAVDASEQINLLVNPISDGTVSNTASVTSTSHDPLTDNNQATTTHVIRPPGFTLNPGDPEVPNDEPVTLPPDSELPDIAPRGPGDGLADESLEGMIAEKGANPSTFRRTGKRTAHAASGYVYVVGYAYNGRNYDIYLLKYDSERNEVWTRQIDSGGQDYGYAVELGPNGHVYVAGYTLIGNSYRAVAYSYTRDGDLRWTRTFTGAGTADAFYAISSDSSGVYFAGETHTGVNFDALVVKYDSDGNLLWSRNLPTPSDGTVYATSSTFCGLTTSGGQTGNCRLIIAGAQGSRERHAFLAELSSTDGMLLTTQEREASGPINAMVSDGMHLFAAANTADGDWALTRFDAQLNTVWHHVYNFNAEARVRALILDPSGLLLAAGTLTREGHDDLLIGMFDADGARLDYMSITGGAQESGHGIAVTSDQRLLVSGQRSIKPGNTRFLLFRVFN